MGPIEDNEVKKRLIFAFALMAMGLNGMAQDMAPQGVQGLRRGLSPNDYGLREAQNGTDRYRALLKTHKEAVRLGFDVDYTGIDTLRIEIPEGAESIPLTPRNDFRGLTLIVTNNVKNFFLFGYVGKTHEVAVEKALIDGGDFGSIDALARGSKVLIVNDQNPWVANRIGYNSAAYRKDLLVLNNGVAQNSVTASYATPASDPKCVYFDFHADTLTFKNLTFLRTEGCANKTYLVSVKNRNNVLIDNIAVATPKSKLLADAVISVTNAANVTISNTTVDGTYSAAGRADGYGYAFSLNNLWNSRFVNVTAHGNWGVFGTNCLSATELDSCDINRFDIHCYGKDVVCRNCSFRNKQTQFGSFYGTLRFENCLFDDCLPIRVRGSYNAYTPFDIELADCTFRATARYHALINIQYKQTEPNSRPELKERCWPNVKISNLRVELPPLVRRVVLFDPTGETSVCKEAVGYMSEVTVDGLEVYRNGREANCEFVLSSVKVTTKKPFWLERKNEQGKNRWTENIVSGI